jgi:hypothetical protein
MTKTQANVLHVLHVLAADEMNRTQEITAVSGKTRLKARPVVDQLNRVETRIKTTMAIHGSDVHAAAVAHDKGYRRTRFEAWTARAFQSEASLAMTIRRKQTVQRVADEVDHAETNVTRMRVMIGVVAEPSVRKLTQISRNGVRFGRVAETTRMTRPLAADGGADAVEAVAVATSKKSNEIPARQTLHQIPFKDPQLLMMITKTTMKWRIFAKKSEAIPAVTVAMRTNNHRPTAKDECVVDAAPKIRARRVNEIHETVEIKNPTQKGSLAANKPRFLHGSIPLIFW